MNKTEMIQTVKDMIGASSCCKELKAAGQNWLNALGTAGEKTAADALLQEVREDIAPIDHAIEFYESPLATQIFGAEKAKALAAHSRDRKAKGEKWCDCPACAACQKILENVSAFA